MISDHSFLSDIRVENESSALVDAGFEIILPILAPDTRESLEQYGNCIHQHPTKPPS